MKSRKPTSAPLSKPIEIAMNHCSFIMVAIIRIVAAMAPTPDASPSMLSRKFKALVMITSQRIVRRTEAAHPIASQVVEQVQETNVEQDHDHRRE